MYNNPFLKRANFFFFNICRNSNITHFYLFIEFGYFTSLSKVEIMLKRKFSMVVLTVKLNSMNKLEVTFVKKEFKNLIKFEISKN